MKASIALLATLGLLLLANLGSGIRAQAGLRPDTTWPPHPTNIVSITQDWQLNGGPTSVGPGETVLLYEVPPNKLFVATGFGMLNGPGWINAFATGALGNDGLTPLRSLDNSSVDLVPGMSSAFAQGPLGLTCRPGSRIILKNLDYVMPHDLYVVTLRGYLVDV